MKYILILLLFISSNSYEREVDKSIIIDKSIRHLSPNLSRSYSRRVAKAVLKASNKWKVDWRTLVSILQQESSMRLDPGMCAVKKCVDFGIGQINFKTWGKKLGLSKNKLITNIEYNIDSSANILALVTRGHNKERNAFSRYHSLNNYHRNNYEQKVCLINRNVNTYAKQTYYKF